MAQDDTIIIIQRDDERVQVSEEKKTKRYYTIGKQTQTATMNNKFWWKTWSILYFTLIKVFKLSLVAHAFIEQRNK